MAKHTIKAPERILIALTSLAFASACAPQEDIPAGPVDQAAAPVATSEKTPAQHLKGQWEVERIDSVTFPKQQGIVNFQSEEFYSHEAGCGGGHPAFFEAGPEGSLRTWRREAVVIGKCSGPRAAELERLLADFMDRANGWSQPQADRLVLTASDGKTAYLKRPVGPVPELEGQWRVVSIDGKAWAGPKAASVSVSYNWFGASGGCNGGGAGWSSPAPGQLAIGSIMATEMLCEPELMKADSAIFGAVGTTTGYRVIAPDRVELLGARTMLLERAD